MHQFWHLKSLLLQQQFPSETGQAIGIYLKNFEMILEKMNLALREAPPGRFKDDTGRHFNIITVIPADNITEIMVDKTIYPAVLWHDEVLLKGSIQIKKPPEPENP